MKFTTLILSLAAITLSACHFKSNSSLFGVEKTRETRGYQCGQNETKSRLLLAEAPDATIQKSGLSDVDIFEINSWDVYLHICVNDDGKITLKRIEVTTEKYPTIHKMYGWVDEPGPHASLAAALYDKDISKIDFRIKNVSNSKESLYLKGRDGFVTLSMFDFNSNNPNKSTFHRAWAGKLEAVNESQVPWEDINQKLDFDTGYLKLTYKYLYNHVECRYIVQKAEVLDKAYWKDVQILTVENDVKVHVDRHCGDSIAVKTLGATYTLGYSYNDKLQKSSNNLSIVYSKDGRKKVQEFKNCDDWRNCGRIK